ncbi:unnamed protein product [Anisakis simplex]|uniref:CCR4-NOT transcription complex subunit 4 n=1 Tax=Anisakis simplex TaxID=6269 RepID=A0A3P6QNU6_ANISI|nr:unnamed protein product [Anisakis simplex]
MCDFQCPLCMELLEIDDIDFYPCKCEYQICRFCWHRLRTDENGLCPACRQPYPENPVNFKPLSASDLLKIKSEKKQKQQQQRLKICESRKHLSAYRVLQKNLVYVVGLSTRVADPEILKRPEYFGKYGRILKVAVGSFASSNGPQSASCTAYVTYAKYEDALRAIQSVNNAQLDGRIVKASLGTTKYCSSFLRSQPCHKPECMYLHDVADNEVSFTKDDMHLGKHAEYEKKLIETTLLKDKANQKDTNRPCLIANNRQKHSQSKSAERSTSLSTHVSSGGGAGSTDKTPAVNITQQQQQQNTTSSSSSSLSSNCNSRRANRSGSRPPNDVITSREKTNRTPNNEMTKNKSVESNLNNHHQYRHHHSREASGGSDENSKPVINNIKRTKDDATTRTKSTAIGSHCHNRNHSGGDNSINENMSVSSCDDDDTSQQQQQQRVCSKSESSKAQKQHQKQHHSPTSNTLRSRLVQWTSPERALPNDTTRHSSCENIEKSKQIIKEEQTSLSCTELRSDGAEVDESLSNSSKSNRKQSDDSTKSLSCQKVSGTSVASTDNANQSNDANKCVSIIFAYLLRIISVSIMCTFGLFQNRHRFIADISSKLGGGCYYLMVAIAGFDPFSESAKGLADLLEEEKSHQPTLQKSSASMPSSMMCLGVGMQQCGGWPSVAALNGYSNGAAYVTTTSIPSSTSPQCNVLSRLSAIQLPNAAYYPGGVVTTSSTNNTPTPTAVGAGACSDYFNSMPMAGMNMAAMMSMGALNAVSMPSNTTVNMSSSNMLTTTNAAGQCDLQQQQAKTNLLSSSNSLSFYLPSQQQQQAQQLQNQSHLHSSSSYTSNGSNPAVSKCLSQLSQLLSRRPYSDPPPGLSSNGTYQAYSNGAYQASPSPATNTYSAVPFVTQPSNNNTAIPPPSNVAAAPSIDSAQLSEWQQGLKALLPNVNVRFVSELNAAGYPSTKSLTSATLHQQSQSPGTPQHQQQLHSNRSVAAMIAYANGNNGNQSSSPSQIPMNPLSNQAQSQLNSMLSTSAAMNASPTTSQSSSSVSYAHHQPVVPQWMPPPPGFSHISKR